MSFELSVLLGDNSERPYNKIEQNYNNCNHQKEDKCWAWNEGHRLDFRFPPRIMRNMEVVDLNRGEGEIEALRHLGVVEAG